MNIRTHIARFGLVGLLALSMAGCANARDRRTDNTLIGAGLGAAAGAVISEGDPLYTLGGAAAGGLLGNILTEDRHYHRGRDWDRGRHYYNGPRHRHVKRHHYRGHKHHHRHRH